MGITLLLVRHATHNAVGRILCGRMAGIHISEEGRLQASRLATHVGLRSPRLLLTSPQERCMETAIPIGSASGLEPIESAAFDEIDFGSWTGLRFDKLAGDPVWERWNAERETSVPPHGESMRQAQTRAVSALQCLQAAHADGSIVVVSHADVIKAVILWCLGLTLDAHARFDIEPASLSTMVLWDGGAKLLRLNEGIE